MNFSLNLFGKLKCLFKFNQWNYFICNMNTTTIYFPLFKKCILVYELWLVSHACVFFLGDFCCSILMSKIIELIQITQTIGYFYFHTRFCYSVKQLPHNNRCFEWKCLKLCLMFGCSLFGKNRQSPQSLVYPPLKEDYYFLPQRHGKDYWMHITKWTFLYRRTRQGSYTRNCQNRPEI